MSVLTWKCCDRELLLGDRVLVMGILNATPDSFYDGGKYSVLENALLQADAMVEAGADLIDVGGESTRPGADAVSPDEEIRRVVPVIENLARRLETPLSIDTMKAQVAQAAIDAGACIVNDVSAASADAEMAGVVARNRAGAVLMHMRGNPQTMQEKPEYSDVVSNVRDYLAERLHSLVSQGVAEEQVVLDPGIGFGKSLQHNIDLINGIPELRKIGRPLLIGLSRKSFLERITGRDVDHRLSATLAATSIAIRNGTRILRVHDVKETCDMVRVLHRMENKEF